MENPKNGDSCEAPNLTNVSNDEENYV